MLQDLQNIDHIENYEVRGMKQLYFILWTIGEKFPAHKSFVNLDLPRHESYL